VPMLGPSAPAWAVRSGSSPLKFFASGRFRNEDSHLPLRVHALQSFHGETHLSRFLSADSARLF